MTTPGINVDVGSAVGAVFGGLDSLFTSDDEREAARLEEVKAYLAPHLMQAQANIEEAKHPSVFVAGWRPALGWTCALALLWQMLARDFIVILLVVLVREDLVPKLPDIDTGQVIALVTTLLGLAGARTIEKLRGVERNN